MSRSKQGRQNGHEEEEEAEKNQGERLSSEAKGLRNLLNFIFQQKLSYFPRSLKSFCRYLTPPIFTFFISKGYCLLMPGKIEGDMKQEDHK